MKNETNSPAAGTLPDTPPLTEKLLRMVDHPEEIDQAVARLGVPSSLVNPYFATPVNLSHFDLEDGIHLPIQLTARPGGRKSIYFLHAGEKVLTGLVITGNRLLLSYVARETGCSIPAESGSEYSEELRTREGKLVSKIQGSLEIIDPSRGEGRIVAEAHGCAEGKKVEKSWSIGWSFIKHTVIRTDDTASPA